MLYFIGRILSIIGLMVMNITIDLLWFKMSAVMGIMILIFSALLIYKAIMVMRKVKTTKPTFKYDILKYMN